MLERTESALTEPTTVMAMRIRVADVRRRYLSTSLYSRGVGVFGALGGLAEVPRFLYGAFLPHSLHLSCIAGTGEGLQDTESCVDISSAFPSSSSFKSISTGYGHSAAVTSEGNKQHPSSS